jgi:hypothetical protein
MNLLLDSLMRSVADCFHPRVIVLSLLPLALMAVAALGLGYFYWQPAVAGVQELVMDWAWLAWLVGWLEGLGLSELSAWLAPVIVVALATPLIVVVVLCAVAMLMTPAMLEQVATRRFPLLVRKKGGSFWKGAWLALWTTLLALTALVLSIPLWLVPPLVLILPPLIWGWLTYKVMSYDALAEHASREERETLLRRHRTPLMAMGVLTGYLGAAPSLVWASGVLFVALAPVLIPVAIWIYTLVFALSSLWFSHYALAALQALRSEPSSSTPQAQRLHAP